jgi:hypothetical protein
MSENFTAREIIKAQPASLGKYRIRHAYAVGYESPLNQLLFGQRYNQ